MASPAVAGVARSASFPPVAARLNLIGARATGANSKVLYELDGGDRTKVKSFKVKVEPGAINVCVPHTEERIG